MSYTKSCKCGIDEYGLVVEAREDFFRGGTFFFLALSSSFVAPPTEDIPLDILSILTTIRTTSHERLQNILTLCNEFVTWKTECILSSFFKLLPNVDKEQVIHGTVRLIFNPLSLHYN